MREKAGSPATPAARCRNCRRGSFILNLPLASYHSITSSASASSEKGTARPSIHAVSALIISSILVDCTAGKQSADQRRNAVSPRPATSRQWYADQHRMGHGSFSQGEERHECHGGCRHNEECGIRRCFTKRFPLGQFSQTVAQAAVEARSYFKSPDEILEVNIHASRSA